MKKFIQNYFTKARRLTDEFSECNIPVHAGQTAFFMMLSFFPFMMLVFVLLNYIPLTATDFEEWLLPLIPDSFSDVMHGFIDEVYKENSSGRISFAVITAIWLSSKAFVSLQQGLNAMYKTKENRNFVLLRIYAVIYSLVFAVMLIAVFALIVFGNKIHDHFFMNFSVIESIIHFRMIICISVLFLFFMVLFYFLPNKKHNLKKQIPGAIFSSMAWILFSYFFSIYVDNYSNYASFYGAMTTIALIMVWLYGCMYMIFLGGFINYSLENDLWRSR